MKITSLHHVAYAVEHYKRVRKFWGQLGFTLLQDQNMPEEKAASVFWIGQVQIQLHPTAACPVAAEWRENHLRDDLYQICLGVESIDDVIAELTAAGFETPEPETTAQGRQFYLDKKYTGEYYLGFIELSDVLKNRTTEEQQLAVAAQMGVTGLTAKQIAHNDLGITNIHHIGITVADYERARHLWEDVLGLEALYQNFKERKFEEDAMYLGDAQIHIYRSQNPALKFCWWPQKNGDGLETLSVCVDNINRTIYDLRCKGMDIASYGAESMSQGMSCFIDKEFTAGNDFELVEFHYFLKGKPVEKMKEIVYHFFGDGTVL